MWLRKFLVGLFVCVIPMVGLGLVVGLIVTQNSLRAAQATILRQAEVIAQNDAALEEARASRQRLKEEFQQILDEDTRANILRAR